MRVVGSGPTNGLDHRGGKRPPGSGVRSTRRATEAGHRSRQHSLPGAASLAGAALLLVLSAGPAAAHEPLFMMSHEAPGKGASDLHVALHGERGEIEDETTFELEFTRGLTRNLAVKAGVPYVRREVRPPGGYATEDGVGDPTVRVKWRFWDRDQLGAKLAAAVMLQSTVPIGDGSGRLGRDRPVVTAGLSHGRESLVWYYFVDARFRRQFADRGSRRGDRLHLDVAQGWRPYLGGLDQTDLVLFFEINYRHAARDRVRHQDVSGSGGDFLFMAPEILLSPHNRLMFKAGLQVPLVQAVDSAARRAGTAFVLETEVRF